MFTPHFLTALEDLAISLPESVLTEIANFLPHTQTLATQQWQYQLQNLLPSNPIRVQTIDFINLWHQHQPPLTATAIALALITNAATTRKIQREYQVDPIWTMPNPQREWIRQTETTLLHLIENTEQELLIISFAIYQVPELVQALLSAIQRSVKVTMIVELPETQGKIRFGIFQAFPTTLLEQLDIYHWPTKRRPLNSQGKFGSLHIKAMISDQRKVFIGSANLTQYALNLNLELGLTAHQPNLARQITKTINGMIHSRILLRL